MYNLFCFSILPLKESKLNFKLSPENKIKQIYIYINRHSEIKKRKIKLRNPSQLSSLWTSPNLILEFPNSFFHCSSTKFPNSCDISPKNFRHQLHPVMISCARVQGNIMYSVHTQYIIHSLLPRLRRLAK